VVHWSTTVSRPPGRPRSRFVQNPHRSSNACGAALGRAGRATGDLIESRPRRRGRDESAGCRRSGPCGLSAYRYGEDAIYMHHPSHRRGLTRWLEFDVGQRRRRALVSSRDAVRRGHRGVLARPNNGPGSVRQSHPRSDRRPMRHRPPRRALTSRSKALSLISNESIVEQRSALVATNVVLL
jgi:hypothetical protein